jgi:hypothetical protein
MRRSGDARIGRSDVRSALALLLCTLTAMPVMADLSGQERRIAAAIDGQQPWALDFLEQLVNVNSGTHNLPGGHPRRRPAAAPV